MTEIKPTYHEVGDGIWVCIADADTRAVVGAKTSRAYNLESRWARIINEAEEMVWGDAPPEVRRFLDQNVAGYSHASIAEMAECWVHVKRLGWPMAWLIEDFPLFIGQEVSTRAVDMTKDPAPCRWAPEETHELHAMWLEAFQDLKQSLGQSGGYKFDQIRWALPGTTPAGVTYAGQVRAFVRQLEEIKGLESIRYNKLAIAFEHGIAANAPETSAAIGRGPRTPSVLWQVKPVYYKDTPQKKSGAVQVSRGTSPRSVSASSLGLRKQRGARERLDKAYNMLGQFCLRIQCSVAAARDWHRHRAVMPWRIRVARKASNGALIPSPFYPQAKYPEYDQLWSKSSEVFNDLLHKDLPQRGTSWDSLFALPFGAMVELECVGTLPHVLYMLELRYSSSGANFEYKEQARQGLIELARSLGPEDAHHLNILGCLPEHERERYSYLTAP